MFLILDEIKKENKHLNFMVSHKVIASDERVPDFCLFKLCLCTLKIQSEI